MKKSNEFYELFNIFDECLQSEKNNLEKNQKRVLKGSSGLAGSLLF
jgi:hypothetical protein